MSRLSPHDTFDPPVITRLTSRRGTVLHARFKPGALTTLYSATWDGRPLRLFETGSTAGAATTMPFEAVDLLGVSRDGDWIVAIENGSSPNPILTLAPTGPGEPRQLPIGNLQPRSWGAGWIPGTGSPDDGGEIVFAARVPGESTRLFRLPLGGDSSPRPIFPEALKLSANPVAISPDGRRLVVMPTDGAPVQFAIEGGDPHPVRGVEAGEPPIRFDRDGRHLYVLASSTLPAQIVRVDTETGERVPWRRLSPPDTAGVFSADYVKLSEDGSTYVYSTRRVLSSLVRVVRAG